MPLPVLPHVTCNGPAPDALCCDASRNVASFSPQHVAICRKSSFTPDALRCGAAQRRAAPCGTATQRSRCERTFRLLVERQNVMACCVRDATGVRVAAECVARSRSEETQECACRLLRALAEGNPKFQMQVYRGLTALLSSSSAKAQHMAAQSLRIAQV